MPNPIGKPSVYAQMGFEVIKQDPEEKLVFENTKRAANVQKVVHSYKENSTGDGYNVKAYTYKPQSVASRDTSVKFSQCNQSMEDLFMGTKDKSDWNSEQT
jgi:hypothetical protein